ncbi:uncharacterized protein LOC112457239 [Temnothorax curvispinosus]|uniref:Uncharacterized protein LOC112457239 n=1 Tax=Temnothorax curvispinosus TaxID=300111 RepID=A0A6J1Q4T9_9HYME|nr:uncharacterized protein LOC112457239 [Temnothorax curvispinosus]
MADPARQIEALTAAVNSLLQLQLNKEKSEASSSAHTSSHSEMYNHLSTRVEKYHYGTGDETKPFAKWLLRHEYTVVTEASCLPPQMQTRLVLDKLGQTEFDRLVDHVAPTDSSSMTQEALITTLKELFRDKIPITRRRIEILNYRYDRSTPITEHLGRINRHAADFDRSKLTDDNLRILLLLQLFCFSSDNDELKKIALRVIEKNQAASLKDVVAELEAYMNVASGLKTLGNPTKHSQVSVLNIAQSKRKEKKASYRKSTPEVDTSKAKPSFAMTLQYDTGSDITVIGKEDWIRIGSPKLVSSNTVEHAGGSEFDIIGRFYCTIRALGRNGVNLFGLNAIDSLNLWSTPLSELHPGSPALDSQPATSPTSKASSVHQMYAQPPNLLKSDQGVTPNLLKSDQGVTSQHNVYLEDVLQHFPILFADDLGTCSNFKVKFNIARDARPVQSKCRQIPYAIEALLAEELKRLESLGIIESVATSNWTSPIVIAKKQNGKIRLCGDYSTGVNSVLISNSHPLPTVDNINAKLNGNRYFNVLDLSDAFFQLEIDKDHREITTIVTPFGLYRYTREPFGLKTAPADFQQAMDNTLEGLEECPHILMTS